MKQKTLCKLCNKELDQFLDLKSVDLGEGICLECDAKMEEEINHGRHD